VKELAVCPLKFDFSFESEDTTEGMKRLISEEVSNFRAEVRSPATRQNSASKRQDTLPIPSRDELPDQAISNTLPEERALADSPIEVMSSNNLERDLQFGT